MDMYKWLTEMFPYNRSLTGEGVRKTISYLKEINPNLRMHEISSGSHVYDWKIPQEWSVNEAKLTDESGKIVLDFDVNNLHLLGYSAPFKGWVTKQELLEHVYTLEDKPSAIPYRTSYYEKRWGFCIEYEKVRSLDSSRYFVNIDTDFFDGVMNYADIIIQGETTDEFLISTYICHPSMANNELSGPVVASALAKWLSKRSNRYTYRIIFVPETIGAIAYIHQNFQQLIQNVKGGLVLTCCGDEGNFSYIPSRLGNTEIDLICQHELAFIDKSYRKYTWLDRGSDERQYCSPGVELNICSITRSKYGEYGEYHTSDDGLSFVTSAGLNSTLDAVKKIVESFDQNHYYIALNKCEPMMSKRSLYPTSGYNAKMIDVRLMMNILSYCDGRHSVLDIAKVLNREFSQINDVLKKLVDNNLIKKC